MGLVDKIKKDVQRSGNSKNKFTYIRDGEKVRVRFLVDMDEGTEIVFHDSYEKSINIPCRDAYGKECQYCEDDELRTRSNYAWSVWNYETNQVELFMFKVNNCSPVPALTALYENYGTITDRDFVVSCSGKQMSKTFAVIPMDKVKFRNAKAKPFSQSTILKMIDQAWPDENSVDDDDDDEPAKSSRSCKSSAKAKTKRKAVDDDWDDDDDEEEENDYDSMKTIDLFKLCTKRGIEVTKKKPSAYYVTALEEDDSANDDWAEDDDDDDDDWGE